MTTESEEISASCRCRRSTTEQSSKKFVAQDKQVKVAQKNARELNATLQTLVREHDQYLAKLDAE
jgi:hypothetical protein